MSEYWRGVWNDPIIRASMIVAVILVIITFLVLYSSI